MIRRMLRPLLLCLLALPVHADGLKSQKAGADTATTPYGRLSKHGGITTLELWGSPEQAGRAHGYLMAPRIIELIDGYMLDPETIPNPQIYERLILPTVRRQMVWSDAHKRELQAMLEGLRARLGADNVRSAALDRALTIEDLMAINCLADWVGLLCTTATVWGPLTQDGATLTARNLDFPLNNLMSRNQIVLIHHGDGNSIPWVNVTWPGLIGIYTGLSREGVTILLHDARGLPATESVGFTPRALILREALESAEVESFLDDALEVFQEHKVMIGNNIHVSGPARDGRPRAAVFEYDANGRTGHGVTVRHAHINAAAGNALWCTNHMRDRTEPRACTRYERLDRTLQSLADQHQTLSVADAFAMMHTVRQDTTLHTAVIEPDKRIMHLQIPAIAPEPVEFLLDQWLARPPPSLTANGASGP